MVINMNICSTKPFSNLMTRVYVSHSIIIFLCKHKICSLQLDSKLPLVLWQDMFGGKLEPNFKLSKLVRKVKGHSSTQS